MSYESRIPEIALLARERAERAVDTAGQEIEFLARARARKDTGDMAAGIEWRKMRSVMTGKEASGHVVATDWKSNFHEFGTVKKAAQPMLVPAAEEARPGFMYDMSRLYDMSRIT